MDAGDAARMSDPDLNPMFRRRWIEAPSVAIPATRRSTASAVGPIGLALICAWRRKRQAGDATSAVPGSATPR
jgi:hypothetical protein